MDKEQTNCPQGIRFWWHRLGGRGVKILVHPSCALDIQPPSSPPTGGVVCVRKWLKDAAASTWWQWVATGRSNVSEILGSPSRAPRTLWAYEGGPQVCLSTSSSCRLCSPETLDKLMNYVRNGKGELRNTTNKNSSNYESQPWRNRNAYLVNWWKILKFFSLENKQIELVEKF